jgi:hypothetical protein
MMRFELGIEKPDPRRALRSAVTIAAAYVTGGLIPLAPYFAISKAKSALRLSVVVTVAALMMFGYVKGRFYLSVAIAERTLHHASRWASRRRRIHCGEGDHVGPWSNLAEGDLMTTPRPANSVLWHRYTENSSCPVSCAGVTR